MNKTVTIIFIIILSIVTFILTGFFLFLLNGNYNFYQFNFHVGDNYSEKLLLKEEYSSLDEIHIECNSSDVLLEKSLNSLIKEVLFFFSFFAMIRISLKILFVFG